MAEPRMVDPHDVLMTGENSFVRLSNDGGKTIAERVSHWRVLWSPAGQGHALFIESSLLKEIRIYADNASVARFLQRTIEVFLQQPFAGERAVQDFFGAEGHGVILPAGAVRASGREEGTSPSSAASR